MGILGRFKDIMASNIHAIFNREDKHPEQTVEKYLGQLRRDLGQVKAETEARFAVPSVGAAVSVLQTVLASVWREPADWIQMA